jgi:hypothetical protein
MTTILTDLKNTDDIPILPGLEVEVIQHPSMSNKVIALKYDSQKTLLEAFKVIKLQQRIIEGEMTKVIYMDTYKNVA